MRGLPRRVRGALLLEWMVGLSIGVAVSLGAVVWLADQTHQHLLLLERVRLRQELHTLSALIGRELPRAGFSRVWSPGHGAAANPFAQIDVTPQRLVWRIDRHDDGRLDPQDSLALALSEGRLTLRIGTGSAQSLNHPQTLFVTAFEAKLERPLTPNGPCLALLTWRLEGQTRQARHSTSGATTLPNLASPSPCEP